MSKLKNKKLKLLYFFKFIFIILFSLYILFSLVACNHKTSSLEDKVREEVNYLDTNLIKISISINTSDWKTAKKDAKIFYNSWPAILMDLSLMSINDNDISEFSENLDLLIVNINSEDTLNSLKTIANLYSKLPIFCEKSSEEASYTLIYKTKAELLKVYPLLIEEKWEEIYTILEKAENEYMKIFEYANLNSNREYNIKKSSLLLNELKKSSLKKEKEVYLMKHIQLISELQIS